MELILLEDVANLGFKDDIVTVKNGYGQNYLIPQGMAKLATPSAKKMLAEELKQRANKLAKIKADAQAVADSLKDVTLQLSAKAAENGAIYGSISTKDIAEALDKKGFDIDKKKISLNTAVKALGGYTATVKLHREVSVEIPLTVVAE